MANNEGVRLIETYRDNVKGYPGSTQYMFDINNYTYSITIFDEGGKFFYIIRGYELVANWSNMAYMDAESRGIFEYLLGEIEGRIDV